MRKFIDGNGNDSTAAVLTWLSGCQVSISQVTKSGSNGVYTYSLPPARALIVGMSIVVVGCTSSGNNGMFTITALGSGTFTVVNSSAVTESETGAIGTVAANRELFLADLFVINTAPNYNGQYLGKQFLKTDFPSWLKWNYRGTFYPAVISHGEIQSKIGLEADVVDVTWAPTDSDILADDGGSPATTLLTVLQGFGASVFDNGVLEIWRCMMPTIGDCNTLGACLMFSGRIGDLEPDRLKAKISVISRLEVLNIQVPTNVIEPTNVLAQYSVGQIPAGGPASFSVVSGSTATKVFADAGVTMAAGTYDAGYLVFTGGKLAGTYRAVRQQTVESGHHAFYLLEPLPFTPSVADTLAAYVPVPRDYETAIAAGQDVAAFPFVPSPVNSAVVIS